MDDRASVMADYEANPANYDERDELAEDDDDEETGAGSKKRKRKSDVAPKIRQSAADKRQAAVSPFPSFPFSHVFSVILSLGYQIEEEGRCSVFRWRGTRSQEKQDLCWFVYHTFLSSLRARRSSSRSTITEEPAGLTTVKEWRHKLQKVFLGKSSISADVSCRLLPRIPSPHRGRVHSDCNDLRDEADLGRPLRAEY